MNYTVPGYTEISHFRAPYKDSMMGFGADPSAQGMAATKVQVATQAVSLVPPMVVAGNASASANLANLALSQIGKKRKPRVFHLGDIQKNVTYFVGLLNKFADAAVQDRFPAAIRHQAFLEGRRIPTPWNALQSMNLAIICDRNHAWHKAFKQQIAELIRSHDKVQTMFLANAIWKALEAEAMGYTIDLPDDNRRRSGPLSEVFETKAEAEAHFARPEIKGLFAKIFGSLPKPKIKFVSAWRSLGSAMAKLRLDSDVLEGWKLFQMQRLAIAFKAIADKKKLALTQMAPPVTKAELQVVADAKKELDKSDAELKAALKKSVDGLEAAKQENLALKVSIEDLKSLTAREAALPPDSSREQGQLTIAPTAPPPPPVIKAPDDLPVPKNAKGEVPNPDALVASGDSAKDAKEVQADIVAAGLDKPNYLPYLAGAGVLGALAFLVLRPKAAPSATPNSGKRTGTVSEAHKRTVACPQCGAPRGRACKSSRIPGAHTPGGGWGGPPDLDRAHEARKAAYVAAKA